MNFAKDAVPQLPNAAAQLRVAIVVPARNAAVTLREALESALGQDDPRIEVVVVDDGSDDDTRTVASALARGDHRVRVLETGGPSGVAGARNLGVSQTTADYLCFLDADDLIPPSKVRLQASYLDTHPDIAVVYSPAREFTHGSSQPTLEVPMALDGTELRESLLTGGVAFPPHSAMVRSSAFRAVGGFDPIHFHEIEDTFFWLRIALAGLRFSFLPMDPVHYRRHPGAKSANRVMVLEARVALTEWIRGQDAGRDPQRRKALGSRKRFLTLILAETLAQQGDTLAARRKALRLLPTGLRPGQILEVLRFVAHPKRRRWTAAPMAGASDPSSACRESGT